MHVGRKILRSQIGQWIINKYLGGVPDPEWTPVLKFGTGCIALPGERALYQRIRGQWPQV